jgi:hypothetical protein
MAYRRRFNRYRRGGYRSRRRRPMSFYRIRRPRYYNYGRKY